MSIAKHASKGIVVKHGTTATPTTALGQVRNAKYSPGLREMVESTTHDNTVAKSYVDAGLRDTPDMDFDLALASEDTGHEAIRAAQAAGTLYFFTLVLTSGTPSQIAMTGYILDASIPTMTTRGLLEMNIKFKAIAAETYTQ